MGKTLYLDCPSGISGDMFAAALIDLGANEARLRDALDALPIGGYDLVVSRVEKAGLDWCWTPLSRTTTTTWPTCMAIRGARTITVPAITMCIGVPPTCTR